MNPIDQAAAILTFAKLNEERAREARIDAEKMLIALMPKRDEGSVTLSGADYKVSVTYGVNRTVDAAALAAIWSELSDGMRQVFPVKHGLDLKEMRHWQNNDPNEYAVIAQAIVAKPAKAQVKVERIAAVQEVA